MQKRLIFLVNCSLLGRRRLVFLVSLYALRGTREGKIEEVYSSFSLRFLPLCDNVLINDTGFTQSIVPEVKQDSYRSLLSQPVGEKSRKDHFA